MCKIGVKILTKPRPRAKYNSTPTFMKAKICETLAQPVIQVPFHKNVTFRKL